MVQQPEMEWLHALKPPFSRAGDQAEVRLFSGPLTLDDGTGRSVAAEGEIFLKVRPVPDLRLAAVVDTPLDFEPGRVSAAGGTADIFVTRKTTTPSGCTVRARITSPLFRDIRDATATEVRAELINFEMEILGSVVQVDGSSSEARRATWAVDGVDFILDPMPRRKAAGLLLGDGEGYALTHVIAMRRQHGAPFAVADFDAISGPLHDALSFCAGSYVGIACAAGFDDDGSRVWERWAVGRSQPWGNRLSWLPQKASEGLEVAMPLLMTLARPWSGRTLRHLVAAAAEGIADGSVETRLATVITGLELLAWVLLVQDCHEVKDAAFETTNLHKHIERVLTLDSVPLAVPSALPALAGFAKSSAGNSGPGAVVMARNRVVHPPTRGRQIPTTEVLVEAWLLAVWYLQLGLLARCGYSGRTLSPWTRERWDDKPVPWAPPPGLGI